MTTIPDPFHELDTAICRACDVLVDYSETEGDTIDDLRSAFQAALAHHERLESLARRALEALYVECMTHPNTTENATLLNDLRDALGKEKA